MAAMAQKPAARPSIPSMKLTMLAMATIQMIVTGYAIDAEVEDADHRAASRGRSGCRPQCRDGGDGDLAGELDARRQRTDVVDGAEGAMSAAPSITP